MKKILKGYFKSYDEKADLIEFVASTASIDREGESIDPKGWDLSNIGRNLPLLWAHNAHILPIGKVISARVEGESLITGVEFAHKVNAFAKEVYDLVKAGFLKAVSVGFMPISYDAQGKMTSQELLELSIVNVPANKEALESNEYIAFTKSLKELDDKVEKSPACRMEGESKDECVSRKIPEIMKEDSTIKQDQAVAIAENVCKKLCGEEKKEIPENIRNEIRIAITSLSNLLNETQPPAKKGGVNIQETPSTTRDKRIYKSVQLVDRVVEAVIHELKNGGEI